MRFWRLSHRWLGVFAALVLVLAAATGWALMHPEWLQGQDLRHLAADPQDPKHLLAGGPQGFWRSTDGGRTWEDVTLRVPTANVVALASGQGGFAVAFRELGIWRSVDGYIWDPVELAEWERVSALSFQGNELVVLSDQGLYTAGQTIALQPSLLRRIHDWHTGWAWGAIGARIVEAGAIALLILTVSGLVLFARTRRRRRRPTITLLRETPATVPQSSPEA